MALTSTGTITNIFPSGSPSGAPISVIVTTSAGTPTVFHQCLTSSTIALSGSQDIITSLYAYLATTAAARQIQLLLNTTSSAAALPVTLQVGGGPVMVLANFPMSGTSNAVSVISTSTAAGVYAYGTVSQIVV